MNETIDNNRNGIVDSEEYSFSDTTILSDTYDSWEGDIADIKEYVPDKEFRAFQEDPTVGTLFLARYHKYLEDKNISYNKESGELDILQRVGYQPTDTDGDGIVDQLESEINGLKKTSKDSDDDGLDDFREITIGSDPTNIDTDNDGLTDYFEATHLGLDPNVPYIHPDGLEYQVEGSTFFYFGMNQDSDGDGLTNRLERLLGYKVRKADKDVDGLEDGKEYILGTDPTLMDSDFDGFTDGAEAKHEELLPFKADYEAYDHLPYLITPIGQMTNETRELKEKVKDHYQKLKKSWDDGNGTNPANQRDSDGDGITDYAEEIIGSYRNDEDSNDDCEEYDPYNYCLITDLEQLLRNEDPRP